MKKRRYTVRLVIQGSEFQRRSKLNFFKPFSQADQSISRQYGGTGLGLAICKRLIDAMGGSMTLESEVDRGSCFGFELGFDVDHHQQHIPLSESEVLEGKSLLLVDEEAIYREIFNAQALALGMTVHAVDSGESLLEELDRGLRPDLIMLDLELNGMSCFELARQLQERSEIDAIPRILITASCCLPDGEVLAPLNFHSVCSKPTSTQQLRVILSAALSGKHSTRREARGYGSGPVAALKVLVAEDNAVNRMVVEGMLCKLGADVTLVDDGEQAIQRVFAASAPFDLILMDCEMPVMDGYAATRRIRKWEQDRALKPMKIIALTAHVLPENLEHCLSSGMDERLLKPINSEQLNDALEQIKEFKYAH